MGRKPKPIPELDEKGLMTNLEFRAAMSVLGATLDNMAFRLGIGRRSVAHFRKGDKQIPRHIAYAVRMLLLDATGQDTPLTE